MRSLLLRLQLYKLINIGAKGRGPVLRNEDTKPRFTPLINNSLSFHPV